MRSSRFAMVVLAVAGGSAGGQSIPTPRPLGKVVATGPTMRGVSEVRRLSDGRVLVNDAGSRQVVLLDSMLTHPRVVLDSTGPANGRYGTVGSLIPYVGDSTLFVDREAMVFLVLDPSGAIARVMSLPSGPAMPSGKARLDTRGRLVYDVRGTQIVPTLTSDGGRGSSLLINYWTVLGLNLGSRVVDTLFSLRLDSAVRAAPPGRRGGSGDPPPVAAPVPATPPSLFPVPNDWGVTSDGALAIVRGQDYHIDWVGLDGKITPSAKIAHEWKRLSDDDKAKMADSMTVDRDSANKAMLAIHAADAGRPIYVYDATGRITGVLPGLAAGPPRDGAPPVVLPPRVPPPQALVPVPPLGIPDYLPPFAEGVLADADDHLWIPLPPTMVPAPDRVYEIVDRSAKLIDRIRLPSPQIVGFGPGGIVYLFIRDAGTGHLEQVRFR